MKNRLKLCIFVLTAVIVLACLVSCTRYGTETARHISYELGKLEDNFTDKPSSAKRGDTVEIRTEILFDADIHVYVDGVEIAKTHFDSDYWGYSFTMPDQDVTITAAPYTKAEIYGTGP